jgi:hypothetical protein
MVKQNQGFRKDLNLQETNDETKSLNNLGGSGIANDLRILQNNLRNTSTLSFNTTVGAAISSGYFYFGPTEFVFTNDDVVGVKTDITVGVGVTLYKDNTYYICNSNTEDQFKLSTTPSTVGVNTITVSSLPPPTDIHYTVNSVIVGTGGTGYTGLSTTVTISSPETSWGIRATAVAEVSNGSVVSITVTSEGRGYLSAPKITISKPNVGINTATATLELTTNYYTNIDFIRKDSVSKENILNIIKPTFQDNEGFNYIGGSSINDAFNGIAAANETARYLITKKYKSNQNTTSNNDINVEGSIKINDPQGFNSGTAGLSSSVSPGIFINDTRAFSSNNNPWTQVGTELTTSSDLVSIAELYFANDITITGISTETATNVAVTTYTHKLPVVINGETYYILLRT